MIRYYHYYRQVTSMQHSTTDTERPFECSRHSEYGIRQSKEIPADSSCVALWKWSHPVTTWRRTFVTTI